MDNTNIAARLKAIEEGIRLQKKVFNLLTFRDILSSLKALFTNSPQKIKYHTTALLEK